MKKLAGLLVFAAVGATVLAQTPQAPVFRTGIDIVRVEVQVVGKDTLPIINLNPTQFEVKIDGRTRRVRTLDFIDFSKHLSCSVSGEVIHNNDFQRAGIVEGAQ